jgi:hypothetical protein
MREGFIIMEKLYCLAIKNEGESRLDSDFRFFFESITKAKISSTVCAA